MDSPAAVIPEWDTADRMKKALRQSDVGVQEMADYLDVARNTVSTWINGRIPPSRSTLRLWALRTGVSFEWLCHGDMVPCIPDRNRRNTGSDIMQCLSTILVAA